MILFPEDHWDELASLDPRQTGPNMVMRTLLLPGAGSELLSRRRLLVAPPVPLHFAALHDVMRDVNQAHPPTGLPGMEIVPADSVHHRPAKIRPNAGMMQASGHSYYPARWLACW